MDLKEVNEMSLIEERSHWWIRTRFQYIDKAISFLKNKTIKVAEYGCGTGQNLWYLEKSSQFKNNISSMTGVDPNLTAEYSPEWLSNRINLSSDLNEDVQNSNLILAMDVLEHIEDELDALAMWKKNLSNEGVLLITVPAFQSLWSYHDVFLEHKRRYTKKSLLAVAEKSGLEPIKITYAFGHIFPLVFLIRKLSKAKESQSDLALPPKLINFILITLGKIESFLGGNPFFGTSVIGIFKLKNK